MTRWFCALALLLASLSAAVAQAFPCPQISFGWAQTWYGQPIASASYDSVSQLLYVIFTTQQVSAFSNVPFSAWQTFSQAGSPIGFYNCCIQPSYHALLLQNKNNCPLLYETGAYIWTD